MPSGCQNFLPKISQEPAPLSISLELVPSSSPPLSLCTIVPDHGRGPYMLPSSLTRTGDAVDHAGFVPKPATPFLSPQQRRPYRARDAVPTTLFLSLRRGQPMPSLGLQCHQSCAIPEPATPSSSPSQQGYIEYFSLLFWAYKS
jgi:hypothetical protein